MRIPLQRIIAVIAIPLLLATAVHRLFDIFSVVDHSPPLLVGTNVWSGYEPFYLARGLGYFDERSIRLVEYSSASQVIRAFRNDNIELAALTLDEVLLLQELGQDLRVILVTDVSDGGDVLLARPGIENIAELRGRAIGVENTAVGAYLLTRALQKAAMSVDDVKAVPIEVDGHEHAFNSGAVDAVVTFDPVRSRLVEEGAVQLFDSSDIPGEIVDVLVVRKSVLDQNPEKIKTLLTAWFDGLKYLRDHPNDASQRMSARLRLDPPEVLTSLKGVKLPSAVENIEMLGGAKAGLVDVASRLASVMKQVELLSTDVDVSNLFSAELIESLRKDNE